MPTREQARRARLEYLRKVQEKLRAQTAKMHKARMDLDKKQEKKNKQMDRER